MASVESRVVPPWYLICILGALSMSPASGDEPKTQSNGSSAKEPDYEAMINGLATRNPVPKIVVIEYSGFPEFPAGFDWGEADRVRKLCARLLTNDDPRLWEHFLAHMSDRQYALTVQRFGGNNSSDIRAGAGAENMSVGDICREAAMARFKFSALHTSSKEDDPGVSVPSAYDLLPVALWLKEPPEKSLYELQLEVGEAALRNIESQKSTKPEKTAERIQWLRKDIARLKEKKKPLFFQVSLDDRGKYTAEKAEEIRKRIKVEKDKKSKGEWGA